MVAQQAENTTLTYHPQYWYGYRASKQLQRTEDITIQVAKKRVASQSLLDPGLVSSFCHICAITRTQGIGPKYRLILLKSPNLQEKEWNGPRRVTKKNLDIILEASLAGTVEQKLNTMTTITLNMVKECFGTVKAQEQWNWHLRESRQYGISRQHLGEGETQKDQNHLCSS